MVHPVIHDGEEPAGPLESVGTAGLQVEGAQSPVLQLSHKVLGTDALCEVELALAVQTQNVLEYPGRSVEIEFTTDETKGVTKGEDFSCNDGLSESREYFQLNYSYTPL